MHWSWQKHFLADNVCDIVDECFASL